MPRPRTKPGTYGKIQVRKLRDRKGQVAALHEARAYFRMADGSVKEVRRRGSSEEKARNALKDRMATLVHEATGGNITSDTRMARVAELWLEDFELKVTLGKRAPKSLYDYKDTERNHLRPLLGELSCLEVTVGACDKAIKAIHARHGHGAAKKAKTVLGQVCALAVRHGAMSSNPVRSVEWVETERKDEDVLVLEPHQRDDFMQKLAAHAQAKAEGPELGPRAKAWTDLPDIAAAILSTGGRIGEVTALLPEDIDTTARTVWLGHHLVRVAGQGMVRVKGRKGKQRGVLVKVPEWSLPMWRRVKIAAGQGPVFPAWNGEWVDPSNVTKRFRRACDEIGFEKIASHVLRHTTGTHLGDSGASPTDIGDQLGNDPTVAEKHYRRKRVANAKTADLLESMMPNGLPKTPQKRA